MLGVFLAGYFLGVISLGVWSDLRRKVTSAQHREQAFQQVAERRGMRGLH